MSGETEPPCMVLINKSFDALIIHKEQEYIWFVGMDLNGFRDIRALPVSSRTEPPQQVMTYIPFDAPLQRKQEYIKWRGRDVNSIKYFAIPGG